MSIFKSFNNGLQKMIAKVEYPMYIVQQDYKYRCTCNDIASKQGNLNCPKCLGTGYKIKIRKIKGVWQPEEITIRIDSMPNNVLSGVFYFREQGNLNVEEGNVVIRDQDNIEIIQKAKRFYSNSNKEVIYYQCTSVKKRNYRNEFWKMFCDLVGKVDL